MPARAGILDQLARIFHPVRPRQDRGQRQAFYGGLLGVPGKRRDIDRLARAICAPVGGHEHIDRRRGLAPLDPAVGQVELRVGQRQEGNVGVALLDHHHGRGRPARAARQARVEDRIALIIGRRRAQHGVGAVQQFNRHARLGRSRPQRADHDMQPIHARQGGDPKIRHDEPLPARRHDIGVHARNRRFQRIDARRHPLQRVAQGQAGGDVLVDLLAHGGGAGPDLFAHSFGEGVFRIDLNRRSEIIVLDRPQQVAVGHAEQRQVQLFGVHRLDRQGDVGGVRQHIAPAREAHPGIAVADVLRDLDRLRRGLAIRRRKAFAESHGVAFAMLQPRHAQLPPAAGFDHHAGLAQLDKGRIVHARGDKVLGKRRADARAGQIGLDRRFRDAEPVLADRHVQKRRRIRPFLQGLRQPQRLHRVTTPAIAL